MQQWQQLSSQQKAIAGILVGVIVISLTAMIYLFVSRTRRPTPTAALGVGQPGQQAQAEPIGGGPGQPAVGQQPTLGQQPTTPGMPTLGAGTGPTLTLGAPAPTPTLGVPTAPGAPGATIQPEVPAVKPPEPGRDDPFEPIEQGPSPVEPPVVAEGGPLPPMPPPAVASQPTETQFSVLMGGLPQPTPPPARLSAFRVATGPRRMEDPLLRLAGTMLTADRIAAIVQLPDGRHRVVRPGSQITVNDQVFTVTQITTDRVVLTGPSGEERIATRRPVQQVPGAVGVGPGFAGPGFMGPSAGAGPGAVGGL
ncbi:MAG: hypothetical protein NZ959_05265 [Armatimonadetes bacterium]|nr:hypothetical protein [Armatimonadota bacterium]MDW8122255.1 hypothetical protein [Armatimonadota bacterium]